MGLSSEWISSGPHAFTQDPILHLEEMLSDCYKINQVAIRHTNRTLAVESKKLPVTILKNSGRESNPRRSSLENGGWIYRLPT